MFIFRNIPAQGQYDIYATTPGCVGSSNCFQRTQVEYQLQLLPGVVSTIISDQNTFSDRRTLLYSGSISPVFSTFRPSITLKPATNATKPDGDNISIMADTIEFVRNVTAPPLVSILEYTPSLNNASDNTTISWKPLNRMVSIITVSSCCTDFLFFFLIRTIASWVYSLLNRCI